MYDLNEFKEKFNPVLNAFINKKVGEFLQKQKDPFIKDFIYYSKNLITGGGKRIRPYIAYLAYKTFGGKKDDESIELFISLELFHNFGLVHDDVIDQSTTRHGQKTIHFYIKEKLREEKRMGNPEHIGNSQAILVGDLLFSWSFENFDNAQFDKEQIHAAKKYFFEMIDDVCLGQIIDVDLTTRDRPDWNLIQEKTRLKTSRYSFVKPMQIGAILADPGYGMDDFFEKLGTKLGIAFQIQDDLLDIIGNPKNTRKTPLIDIEEHQHTFFTNYLFEHADEGKKEYFNGIFGKKIKEDEKEKIKNLFIQSGAIGAGRKIIEENINDAENLVKQTDIKEEYKQKFLDLIQLIGQRQG